MTRRIGAWVVLGVFFALPIATALGDEIEPESISGSLASIRYASSIAWLVAAGALAWLMKAGFTLAETGLVRAKNAAHSAALALGTFAVTVLGFGLCGFAWMFGGHGDFPTLHPWTSPLGASMVSVNGFGHIWDLAGFRGFALLGPEGTSGAILAVFFFHAALIDVAVTIPTGAMLERWRLGSALIFGFIAAAFIVPVYGGWVWGGGWLSDLGAMYGLGSGVVDFAGSGVIHLTGGVLALAGALAVGPRIGKANSDGTANPIACHNVPMVVVGSMVLAVGWIGLNLGRTMSAFDPAVAVIATTSLLAAASGCLASLAMTRWTFGKPDPTMGCNGLLAGLVAISASCPYVSPLASVLIGSIAGVLVVASILFIDKTLGIDDPVGAISVHGVCGAFGLLCVGIFARAEPLGAGATIDHGGAFEGAGLGQFGAQVVGVVANLAWVFPTALVSFAVINRVVGNRVGARVEIDGLDVPETGILGYVGEETYAVRTAGQAFLATFGPGVPPKSASKPTPSTIAPAKSKRRPPRR